MHPLKDYRKNNRPFFQILDLTRIRGLLLINIRNASLIPHTICREYKLLNLLEFSSSRKRMSVILSDEQGKIFLLCKGADRFVLLLFDLSL